MVDLDIVSKILEENLGVSLYKIMVRGYRGGLDEFVKNGVEKDDLVGKMTLNAMNYGFEGRVKALLKRVLKFYKHLYNQSVRFNEIRNEYVEIKNDAVKAGVLDNGFIFKDVMIAHVDLAIKKAEKLKDPTMEMFVEGLDEILDKSVTALRKLRIELNKVTDWSSKEALAEAEKVLNCIKAWGNYRIVNCLTSMIQPTSDVLAPLQEGVEIAKQWAKRVNGVCSRNVRCDKDSVGALLWENDQLKLWCGLE